MTYSEVIQRLFNVNLHGGIKLGLSNCHQLDRLLGFPHKSFQSIHVAGTNGKGSVTTKIAQSFQYAGYRVGLYTSPHISCFRERIQVNGQMISEESVTTLLSGIFEKANREKIHATFFELTTFLAFQYFAQQKVEIAVLETGLGGRLDATNIVNPLLSIITSISLEHTEILGSTLEAIALEKAGIIKPQVPVIAGPRMPHTIIKEVAQQNQSPYEEVKGNFKNFDEENKAVAKQALKRLKIPEDCIAKGIVAVPKCRMEILTAKQCPQFSQFPEALILDVGHNPDGLSNLFKAIRQKYPQKEIRILFGLSKSKDIMSCLEVLKEHGSHFHLVEAANGRGIETADLQRVMMNIGIPLPQISVGSSIEQSVKEALTMGAAKQQIVLICGTFFIMAPVRQTLGIVEPIDQTDMNERNKSTR
jgi:dihydrofolate synthase/folylpolyglutamate synthase